MAKTRDRSDLKPLFMGGDIDMRHRYVEGLHHAGLESESAG